MKELNESIITLFYSTDIYLPTKTLTLVGDVDESLFDNFIKGIHVLDSFSGTINIKLMSDGGDVSVGRAIYSAIKGCKNFVRITCYGEVASCGTIILMAGDERIMTEDSKLMLHIGYEGLGLNHPRNVDSSYQNLRNDEKWIEDIYLERINDKRIKDKKKKMTREEIKDLLIFDRYFDPYEAKSLGLIDAIGEKQ